MLRGRAVRTSSSSRLSLDFAKFCYKIHNLAHACFDFFLPSVLLSLVGCIPRLYVRYRIYVLYAVIESRLFSKRVSFGPPLLLPQPPSSLPNPCTGHNRSNQLITFISAVYLIFIFHSAPQVSEQVYWQKGGGTFNRNQKTSTRETEETTEAIHRVSSSSLCTRGEERETCALIRLWAGSLSEVILERPGWEGPEKITSWWTVFNATQCAIRSIELQKKVERARSWQILISTTSTCSFLPPLARIQYIETDPTLGRKQESRRSEKKRLISRGFSRNSP